MWSMPRDRQTLTAPDMEALKMDQRTPSIHFEDIPLAEARMITRGPRMDATLYQTLKSKILSLGDHATRMELAPEINRTTMKTRILRIAREVNVPVTIRRVPGGLALWRSTDEDLRQAREVAQRLRGARQKRRARPSRRRA